MIVETVECLRSGNVEHFNAKAIGLIADAYEEGYNVFIRHEDEAPHEM